MFNIKRDRPMLTPYHLYHDEAERVLLAMSEAERTAWLDRVKAFMTEVVTTTPLEKPKPDYRWIIGELPCTYTFKQG